MTVKECKDCGGKVSKSAKACPHCGAKQQKSVGILGWIFVLVVVLPIAWNFGTGMNESGTASSSSATASNSSSKPSVEPEKPTEPERWDYYSYTDDMTDAKVEIASIESTNSVMFEFPYSKSGGSYLTISFRKKPNDFDAYMRIDKGQMLCSSVECKFLLKVGDGPVQTWTGLPSSTHDSDIMFIRDAAQFSRIVERGDPIKIGIEFYQAGSKTFAFNTEDYRPIN